MPAENTKNLTKAELTPGQWLLVIPTTGTLDWRGSERAEYVQYDSLPPASLEGNTLKGYKEFDAVAGFGIYFRTWATNPLLVVTVSS